jgi:hypothetical protein
MLVSWLAITVTLAPTSPNASSVPEPSERVWRLSARGGVGRARVLSDGQTLALRVGNPEGAISGADGCRLSALPAGTGSAAVRLVLPPPWRWAGQIVAERSGLSVSARADGGLGERILAPLPRSVPSAFRSQALAAAETALRSRDLSEAVARFEALRSNYALRTWAELRLADLALIGGKRAEACRRYTELTDGMAQRTIGLLGALRAAVLDCGLAVVSWADLLDRSALIEGRVGNFLRREAVAALERSSPADLDEALTSLTHSPTCRGPLAGACAAAHDALLARAIRTREPLQVALSYQHHRAELGRHPQAADLLLLTASAYLALDLPQEAIGVLDFLATLRPKNAIWTTAETRAQSTWLRLKAAELSEDAQEQLRLSQLFTHRFGPLPPAAGAPEGDTARLRRDLDQALERLGTLERLANAREVSASRKGEKP